MEDLTWKMRISVLWIFMAVAMSATMLLALLGPGVIEEIITGEVEGMQINSGLLAMFSLFWLIPLVMAFLTLILKDKVNRWTNIILGGFFTFFNIVHIIGHLAGGKVTIEHWLFGIPTIVVAFLIFWHAWKWPK
jgi:hypothetical protein